MRSSTQRQRLNASHVPGDAPVRRERITLASIVSATADQKLQSSWYIAGVRASDTTPASHAAQMEVYRRLGPAGRVRLAASLSADTRELTRAGIRSRHPTYTDEEVDFALRRVLYGDDLVGRAWPGRSLIEP